MKPSVPQQDVTIKVEQPSIELPKEEPASKTTLGVEDVKATRRPSRFEVTSVQASSAETEKSTPPPEGPKTLEVPTIVEPEKASDDIIPPDEEPKPSEQRRPSFLDTVGIDPNSPAMKALIQLSTKPKKSILKKNYTIHSFGLSGRSGPSSSTPAFTDDSSWKKRFQPLSQDQPNTSNQSYNYRYFIIHDNFQFQKTSKISSMFQNCHWSRGTKMEKCLGQYSKYV